MSPIFHFIQIVTLATWLCVVVFGALGMTMRAGDSGSDITVGATDGNRTADVFMGGLEPWSGTQSQNTVPAIEPIQPLAEPPALPELVDFGPLPDLPPDPASKASLPAESHGAGDSSAARPPAQKAAPAGGHGSEDADTGGSAMSASTRLAAGSMPAPRYPREARRRGQSGTVIVEFTVDESGRVISAVAKEPSRWPLLNQEALRTVRRWKFPPGDVMTMQRSIIFQLR